MDKELQDLINEAKAIGSDQQFIDQLIEAYNQKKKTSQNQKPLRQSQSLLQKSLQSLQRLLQKVLSLLRTKA